MSFNFTQHLAFNNKYVDNLHAFVTILDGFKILNVL